MIIRQRRLCNLIMDTLGFEHRAFRMRSGCDTTTPCAPLSFFKAAARSACIGHALMSRTSARASLPFATRIIAVGRRREQIRPWASMHRGTFRPMISYLYSFAGSPQSNAEIYSALAGGARAPDVEVGSRELTARAKEALRCILLAACKACGCLHHAT
jgi:hypothetical protein